MKIFAGIAMFTLVMSLSTIGETAQDESLVLCFTFEHDSGETIRDLSGNGNDGNIQGQPKFVDGKYGGGLELKAPNDYIEVPDSDSLDVEEVTAMAWVNLPDVNTDQKIVGKTTAGAIANGYVLGVRVGNIQPECWDEAGGYFGVNGGTGVPSKTWAHLAITYSIKDKVMLSYVDGEEQTRTSANGTPLGANTNVLKIGRSPWHDGYPVTGIIDEVRVYNRALSAEEILKAMEEYKAAVTPQGKLSSVWGKIKAQY